MYEAICRLSELLAGDPASKTGARERLKQLAYGLLLDFDDEQQV
jgi:hypothetical protein